MREGKIKLVLVNIADTFGFVPSKLHFWFVIVSGFFVIPTTLHS
jgi:hypothetical protein